LKKKRHTQFIFDQLIFFQNINFSYNHKRYNLERMEYHVCCVHNTNKIQNYVNLRCFLKPWFYCCSYIKFVYLLSWQRGGKVENHTNTLTNFGKNYVIKCNLSKTWTFICTSLAKFVCKFEHVKPSQMSKLELELALQTFVNVFLSQYSFSIDALNVFWQFFGIILAATVIYFSKVWKGKLEGLVFEKK
jgi:hypothetical protein